MITLRKMTADDVPAVMAIQQGAFEAPWTEGMLRKELQQDWSTILLALRGDQILGFAVFWLVVDELHLLNLAVHPSARRQRIGTLLMQALVDFGKQHRCQTATLEVRRSNDGAQALYSGLGFRRVGLRPAYYGDNREDAVIMTATLAGA